MVDLTLPNPRCAGCWLAEDDLLHNYIQYAEQWESEEALAEHIRSDLYLRLLSAIELSQRPPEVNFYFSTRTQGFDLIERFRGELEPGRPGPRRQP